MSDDVNFTTPKPRGGPPQPYVPAPKLPVREPWEVEPLLPPPNDDAVEQDAADEVPTP